MTTSQHDRALIVRYSLPYRSTPVLRLARLAQPSPRVCSPPTRFVAVGRKSLWVATAERNYPIPSRTRKSSSPAPMILRITWESRSPPASTMKAALGLPSAAFGISCSPRSQPSPRPGSARLFLVHPGYKPSPRPGSARPGCTATTRAWCRSLNHPSAHSTTLRPCSSVPHSPSSRRKRRDG